MQHPPEKNLGDARTQPIRIKLDMLVNIIKVMSYSRFGVHC